ncbi:MAG: V-type ATP synthase subunit E [Candidatus Heritagella sp.]
MTGLDTILQAIAQDTKKSCDGILQEYRQKAAAIEQDTQKQLAALQEDSARKIAALQQESSERAASAAQLSRRRGVLSQKQKIIASMIDEARKTLCELPDDQYFSTLISLGRQYALPQPGVLVLGPRDHARMPADFLAKMNAALPAGASLTLQDEADPRAQDGFLLLYGGIEENCTFRALFTAKQEELQDKVQQMLFA